MTASEAQRWERGSLVAAVPAPRPRDPRGGITNRDAAPSGSARRYPTFWYFAPAAPHTGHLSGGTPNSTSPQTGHR